MPQDFWRNSGFHLLERNRDGRLVITDDFLRAYLLRPEVRPIEESGPNECELHQALMEAPRHEVDPAMLEAVEDPDTRDNYRILLAFLERLKHSPSIEACYLGIFSGKGVTVPPLFIDQLAQVILRSILDLCDDPLELRAAELFYREQKANTDDSAVMLADLETVEIHASRGSVPQNPERDVESNAGLDYGSLGRLITDAQTPLSRVDLDVLDVDNAQAYWQRDQRHDFVISLNFGRAANQAFCRLVEKWVRHFLGVEVRMQPLRAIEDRNWAWHVGLDSESTALLNELWRGADVDQGRFRRLLALFRLDFADAAVMRTEVAGKPVYAALSMDENNVVRMKPQNLLVNLPLGRAYETALLG